MPDMFAPPDDDATGDAKFDQTLGLQKEILSNIGRHIVKTLQDDVVDGGADNGTSTVSTRQLVRRKFKHLLEVANQQSNWTEVKNFPNGLQTATKEHKQDKGYGASHTKGPRKKNKLAAALTAYANEARVEARLVQFLDSNIEDAKRFLLSDCFMHQYADDTRMYMVEPISVNESFNHAQRELVLPAPCNEVSFTQHVMELGHAEVMAIWVTDRDEGFKAGRPGQLKKSLTDAWGEVEGMVRKAPAGSDKINAAGRKRNSIVHAMRAGIKLTSNRFDSEKELGLEEGGRKKGEEEGWGETGMPGSDIGQTQRRNVSRVRTNSLSNDAIAVVQRLSQKGWETANHQPVSEGVEIRSADSASFRLSTASHPSKRLEGTATDSVMAEALANAKQGTGAPTGFAAVPAAAPAAHKPGRRMSALGEKMLRIKLKDQPQTKNRDGIGEPVDLDAPASGGISSGTSSASSHGRRDSFALAPAEAKFLNVGFIVERDANRGVKLTVVWNMFFRSPIEFNEQVVTNLKPLVDFNERLQFSYSEKGRTYALWAKLSQESAAAVVG